jgi:hypothetical protein
MPLEAAGVPMSGCEMEIGRQVEPLHATASGHLAPGSGLHVTCCERLGFVGQHLAMLAATTASGWAMTMWACAYAVSSLVAVTVIVVVLWVVLMVVVVVVVDFDSFNRGCCHSSHRQPFALQAQPSCDPVGL